MKRGMVMATLGAAALMAAMAVAAPASAATVGPRYCSDDAAVNGSTEGAGNGQITYLVGATVTHCGNLGLRVNYSHVGGTSWTAWSYSGYSGGSTVQQVGNSALKSTHTTTIGNLNFDSTR